MKLLPFILFVSGSTQLISAMESTRKQINWKLLSNSKEQNRKLIAAANNYIHWATDHNYQPNRHPVYSSIDDTLDDQIAQSNVQVVPWLIDLGVRVNGRERTPFSRSYPMPLITAARVGNEEICTLLIQAGANVTKEHNDYPAIWHAIRNGHVAVTKLLIKHGALDPFKDRKFPSLPNEKPSDNHELICKLLSTHGISLKIRSEQKQDYIDDSLWNDVIKYRLESAKQMIALGANVNHNPPAHIGAPLHVAARNSNEDISLLLLKNGADPNLKNYENGNTALMVTGQAYGKERIYKVLRSYDAQVNLKNNKQQTALHVAAEHGTEKICKLLVADGAEVDSQDNQGNTPLMLAPAYNKEITEIILNAHPDLSIKNTEGNTALMIFAKKYRSDYPDICALLLIHQREKEKRIITFLGCLRHHESASGQTLYLLRKCLLYPHLGSFTLQSLLAAKNNKNKTAYDMRHVDWLKPK